MSTTDLYVVPADTEDPGAMTYPQGRPILSYIARYGWQVEIHTEDGDVLDHHLSAHREDEEEARREADEWAEKYGPGQ